MTRIWVLTSGRTGDDQQSLRLAEALGLPFEEKKIVFNERAAGWRLMLGPSLATVDAAGSSELVPPWPELVISTGWRQVPVVRWIRARSGGRTRLVQMNRPPGLRHFDLVMSAPQFAVPERPNVVRLDWPLQCPPDPETLRKAAGDWQDRLAIYPYPWTVLLLGGSSHPFRLDAPVARQLFEAARERAASAGGSVLISTSRRTPGPVLEALRACVEATSTTPVHLHGWSHDDPDNPYLAYLAGGEEFVVTPDSVSMLVEIARLGRPLSIAPVRRERSSSKGLRAVAKRVLHGTPGRRHRRTGEAISDLASFLGLKFGRDLASVSDRMVAQGWAAHFPGFGGHAGRKLPDEDLSRLAERVREQLLG